MAKAKPQAAALQDRFERIFATIHGSRLGRWFLGINVVVALLMAGAVSVGVVFVTILEREFVGGAVAAVAFGVSMITNAFESYQRTKRPTSLAVLKMRMKEAYRAAVENANLYRE